MLIGLCLFMLVACQKDLSIELPGYTNELVVEAYLDPDIPFYLVSVTQSVPFLDSLYLPVVPNAMVNIVHVGDTVQLNYVDSLGLYLKEHNFNNDNPNWPYFLYVSDANGHTASATTSFLQVPVIDTLQYLVNDSLKVSMQLYFNDIIGQDNFYKVWFGRCTYLPSTQSCVVLASDKIRSWEFSDINYKNQLVPVISNYNFDVNDTIITRLYNIDETFFKFLDTADDAIDAASGPFSRPARIEGNIAGGIGIFTALSYSQSTIILQ